MQESKKNQMQAEYRLASPNEALVAQLMSQTYASQRALINVSSGIMIVKRNWPFLFVAHHMYSHVNTLLGFDVARTFDRCIETVGKQIYRKLRRGTTTGSKGVDWPYYWLLHSFLGTLSVNDSSLVEESVEVPEVIEVPAGADVLATWDNTQTEDETGLMEETSTTVSAPDGSDAAANCTSSAESESQSDAKNSSTNRKRKRPAT
ncbi:hypothetical protein MTO96_022061 [Rhipicephalus appendiculatus]